MLNEADKQYIAETREQIIEGRTIDIIAWGEVDGGENPVTGETTYTESPRVTYSVIWKVPNAAVNNDDRILVGGYEVQEEDRLVTFNDPTLDIDSITYVEHEGERYELVAKTPIGLGRNNRFECVARKTT